MTIYVPLLVLAIGGFVYLIADGHPKIQEAGRIAYAFGLLVCLLQVVRL